MKWAALWDIVSNSLLIFCRSAQQPPFCRRCFACRFLGGAGQDRTGDREGDMPQNTSTRSRHLWRHSLLVLALQKLRMLLWRRELRLWSLDLRASAREDLSFYALRRNVTNHPSAELYVCSSIFFMHEHELWAEIPRPQADNIGTAVVMNSGWCAVRCSGLV